MNTENANPGGDEATGTGSGTAEQATQEANENQETGKEIPEDQDNEDPADEDIKDDDLDLDEDSDDEEKSDEEEG